MSFEVNAYEVMELRNVNKATARVAGLVADYLQQFNHMRGTQSLDLNRLSLTVDDEMVLLKDMHMGKDKDGFIFPWPNNEIDNAKKTLWADDDPIAELAYRIPDAKAVRLEADFSVIRFAGTDYGYAFFLDFVLPVIRENDLYDYVSYKNLEYYDVDPDIELYSLEMEQGEMPDSYQETAGDLSIVKDIPNWFDYNFECVVEADEPIDEGEFCDLVENLQEKFPTLDELPEFDYDFDASLGMYETVELTSGQVKPFLEYLNCVYDFVKARDAKLRLHADFVPSSEPAFAILSFVVEDDKIVAKAKRL